MPTTSSQPGLSYRHHRHQTVCKSFLKLPAEPRNHHFSSLPFDVAFITSNATAKKEQNNITEIIRPSIMLEKRLNFILLFLLFRKIQSLI